MSSFWKLYKSSNILWFFEMGSSLNFNLFWFCFKFCVNQCFNTIVHVLDQVSFRSSKSPFVWNIKNSIICFCMFSVDSSNLDIIFICNLIKLNFIFWKIWKFDMDRCSEGSSQICWAWCYVAKVIIMSKFSNFFNFRSC